VSSASSLFRWSNTLTEPPNAVEGALGLEDLAEVAQERVEFGVGFEADVIPPAVNRSAQEAK